MNFFELLGMHGAVEIGRGGGFADPNSRQRCTYVVDVTVIPWYRMLKGAFANAGVWGCMFRLMTCPSPGLMTALQSLSRALPPNYVGIHARMAFNTLVGEKQFMKRLDESLNATLASNLLCLSSRAGLGERIKPLERILRQSSLPHACRTNSATAKCATVCCASERNGLSMLLARAEVASRGLGAGKIFYAGDSLGMLEYVRSCFSDRLATAAGSAILYGQGRDGHSHSARDSSSRLGQRGHRNAWQSLKSEGRFRMLVDLLTLSKASHVFRLTDSTFSTLARYIAPAKPGERRSDWVRNYVGSRLERVVATNGSHHSKDAFNDYRLQPAQLHDSSCKREAHACGAWRFASSPFAYPSAPPPPAAPPIWERPSILW